MKDLQKLYWESVKELKAIGIIVKTNCITSVEYNNRLTRAFANCHTSRTWGNPYQFKITVSTKVGESDISDTAFKSILIHELLHTLAPMEKHGGKWLELANFVNAKYPQYKIQRVADYEELGLERPPKDAKWRYEVICKSCKAMWHYQTANSKVVKGLLNGRKFHCECGGTDIELRSYKKEK